MALVGRDKNSPVVTIDLLRNPEPPSTSARFVTGRNIGGGTSIYAGWQGYPNINLDFKTLLAGPGIEFVDSAETVSIRATGFRNLAAGDGIDITDNGGSLVISLSADRIPAPNVAFTIRVNYGVNGQIIGFEQVPSEWTAEQIEIDAIYVSYPREVLPSVQMYVHRPVAGYVAQPLALMGLTVAENLTGFFLEGINGSALGIPLGQSGHALLKIVL